MFKSITETDSLMLEMRLGCDRNDRMYYAMKEDVIRHETLSWETAKIFQK